jgi:hypothetical protein
MRARFDPTSPLAYSGCARCGEYREDALLSYAVRGVRLCFNCSTSRKKWQHWGRCVACGKDHLPLEEDHVLGRKYEPELLEPLCRNCHGVKTGLTNHLPNGGSFESYRERVYGGLSAYFEIAPERYFAIPSVRLIAATAATVEIGAFIYRFVKRILK